MYQCITYYIYESVHRNIMKYQIANTTTMSKHGISAKDKEHLLNVVATSNTYHEIGQNPIVEHGLLIPFPDAKTLTPQQIQSTSC